MAMEALQRARGSAIWEEPSEAAWQQKELASLQHEADVLQEQMDGLRQQIQTAEGDLSFSKSTIGHLSRVSTASGSAVFSTSSPSLDEDLQLDEQCRCRIQIAGLEQLRSLLLAELEARLARERGSLLAQHCGMEDACSSAEERAIDAEERANALDLELRSLHWGSLDIAEDLQSSVDASSTHDLPRSASSEFVNCCRGLARARVISEDTSSELARATADFDVVKGMRERLLHEHCQLAETLQQTQDLRAGADAAVARLRAELADEPQRVALSVQHIQAQLRASAMELSSVLCRCSQASVVAADAERELLVASQRFTHYQNDSQNSARSRPPLAMKSAEDINAAALRVECRNAEAAATEFRSMLSAASSEFARLQATSAYRLRQLQFSTEAQTCERRCLSVAAASMHALAVEISPHVVMLERLLQDESAQGEALQRQILPGVGAAAAHAQMSLPTERERAHDGSGRLDRADI